MVTSISHGQEEFINAILKIESNIFIQVTGNQLNCNPPLIGYVLLHTQLKKLQQKEIVLDLIDSVVGMAYSPIFIYRT